MSDPTDATSANALKKKTTPKPRKRKTSDSTGPTLLKRNTASDGNKTDEMSENAAGSDLHTLAALTSKPFIPGELVESIKHMMFGFGDEADPLTETAELMEDLVVEYVQYMTKKAMEMSVIKGKLDPDCFIFLIRKDPERYERINELLRANDEFRAVLNSGFDPSDEKMY